MFIENCVEYVRKHRHFIASDQAKHSVQLECVLKSLQILNNTVEASDENEHGLRLKKPLESFNGIVVNGTPQNISQSIVMQVTEAERSEVVCILEFETRQNLANS